ncbi:MAG: aminotransferase class III-fold pyridoxal phosphate-dependent enzyme [Cyclobacteriaceae bacterium]
MEALAHQILLEHYDLTGELTKQKAYASHNYKVVSDKGKFIFKIYVNPKRTDLVEAESEVLDALKVHDPMLQIPGTVKTKSGHYHVSMQADGHEIIARLLTYLEGKFIGDYDVVADELGTEVGRFLGRLDKAFSSIQNPVITSRRYEWNIQQLFLAEKRLFAIESAPDRNLVKYFILQYKENVQPIALDLRHSLIHNDGHEWNVLTDGKTITGIIDFGDMVYAPIIQELGVSLAYAMMGEENPLPKATKKLAGYHEIIPLTKVEIECLYYFIAARLCISVIMSAYSKKLNPDNEYLTISEKPAWALLKKFLRLSHQKVTNEFLVACGYAVDKENEISVSRNLFLSKALSLSYSSPIKMNAAAFQYMYDSAGKAYLDCANNIFHVGHGHPRVVEAAQRQMAKLNTNTRYLYEALNQYAENLLSRFDARLNKVFFVNSGSAATDLALRLARNYTGTNKTLAMDYGYHGNTAAAIEVSAYKFNGKGGLGKAEHVALAPINQNDDQNVIESAISSGARTFIAESIVGCGGQVPLETNYIQSIHKAIKKAGGVNIADEVQTGFGRVGTHFWAYETQGLNPDIVVLGKPIGNGHPLAAVVTTDEISSAFDNGMEFFSSFGGNPVSCVIGQAVLDVIHEEKLQLNALNVGEYLREQLTELQSKHEIISDVRGTGLFLGIELKRDNEPATDKASKLIDDLKEDGILLGIDGPGRNVIKFKPPMCFNQSNADELAEKLDLALR